MLSKRELNAVLKLEHIFKIYEGSENNAVTALHDVSMQIKTGEFAALIGESGSGKSTLMNIAGCLDAPTQGNVIINGRELSTLTEDQKADLRNHTIGFIFQSFYLQNHLTALDNVMLPMLFAGMDKMERIKRAKELLQMVGMEKRMGHTPAQLSGGQRQRVCIARAMANAPKIIFADEPTGNLDSKTAESIMQLLKSLSKQGISILMVTHNHKHISYADTCYTICDGVLSS